MGNYLRYLHTKIFTMKHAMIQARLKALLEMAENPKMKDDNSPYYISDGEMLDIFLEEIEKIITHK